jgi:hypothetical protein
VIVAAYSAAPSAATKEHLEDGWQDGLNGYFTIRVIQGSTALESSRAYTYILDRLRRMMKHRPQLQHAASETSMLTAAAKWHYGFKDQTSPPDWSAMDETFTNQSSGRTIVIFWYRMHWWHYDKSFPNKAFFEPDKSGFRRLKLAESADNARAISNTQKKRLGDYRYVVAIIRYAKAMYGHRILFFDGQGSGCQSHGSLHTRCACDPQGFHIYGEGPDAIFRHYYCPPLEELVSPVPILVTPLGVHWRHSKFLANPRDKWKFNAPVPNEAARSGDVAFLGTMTDKSRLNLLTFLYALSARRGHGEESHVASNDGEDTFSNRSLQEPKPKIAASLGPVRTDPGNGKRQVSAARSADPNRHAHHRVGCMHVTTPHIKNQSAKSITPCEHEEMNYQDILRHSILCPCPRGVKMESFRMTESLEAGCIPILDDAGEHFGYAWPGIYEHAITTSTEWKTEHFTGEILVDFISRLLDDSEELGRRQKNLVRWYKQHKSNYMHLVDTTLHSVLDRPVKAPPRKISFELVPGRCVWKMDENDRFFVPPASANTCAALFHVYSAEICGDTDDQQRQSLGRWILADCGDGSCVICYRSESALPKTTTPAPTTHPQPTLPVFDKLSNGQKRMVENAGELLVAFGQRGIRADEFRSGWWVDSKYCPHSGYTVLDIQQNSNEHHGDVCRPDRDVFGKPHPKFDVKTGFKAHGFPGNQWECPQGCEHTHPNFSAPYCQLLESNRKPCRVDVPALCSNDGCVVLQPERRPTLPP